MTPLRPDVETEVETKVATSTKISLGIMLTAGALTAIAFIASLLKG
ncbi:MAG: hypothetical protein WC289_01465 [Patescibacteria group bacterium]|jgi:hypothetical protein